MTSQLIGRPTQARLHPFILFGAILAEALLVDIRYNPAEVGRLSFTLAELLAWSLLAVALVIRRPEGVWP